MMTQTTTAKGLTIFCPKCSEREATITLDLSDMNALHCCDCDEDFTLAEAIETLAEGLARWKRVAAWIETAPES